MFDNFEFLEHLKNDKKCWFHFKLRADMLFPDRGDEVNMCHFKETVLGLKI